LHLKLIMRFSGSFTILRVRGIPIRAHWSLLLALPYLGWIFAMHFASVAKTAGVPREGVALHPLVWGLLLAIGLFISVLLHELAHSLVAIRAGGRVREITLMLLGGVSQIENMPRRPRTEAWMAAIGPLTSLALAGLLWLAHEGFPHAAADPRMGLFYLAQINLSLGIFNFLPAFPMDGGRVLRAALTGRLGALRATEIAAQVGKILSIALAAVGILGGNFLLMILALFLYSGAQGEAAVEKARTDLEGLHLGDLIMPRPPTVSLDTPLETVATLMHESGRWELVVLDSGRPVGVVRALVLATISPEDRDTLRVRDLGAHLTASVAILPATGTATAALSTDAESIIVIDGDRIGLLGRADIANALALRAAERGARGRRPPRGQARDAHASA
jgi:Zn-dependent protease